MVSHRLFLLGLLSALFSFGCTAKQECLSNQDCEESQLCISGSCAPISTQTGCAANSDCSASEFCDVAAGRCLPAMSTSMCMSNVDCSMGEVCNLSSGRCEQDTSGQGCTEDADCLDNKYCDSSTRICVECLLPEHCEMSECVDGMCKPNDAECLLDKDCDPPNTICEAKSCVVGCAISMNCGEDSVCDSTTGRCVSITGPCQQDSECNPPREICEANQCIPGCSEFGGIQCTANTVCDSSTGRCIQSNEPICTSDIDCNPPQTVCNPTSERCVEGCVTAGCTAPLICNEQSGHCVTSLACMDDAREDNDAMSRATALTPPFREDLALCTGDDDFFAITLASGDVFTAAISFVHSEGDINAELILNGNVVASSASSSDNESIVFTAQNAGTYYLRMALVSDSGPNPGNTYRLDAAVMTAVCGIDAFEDNDERDSATIIAPGNYTALNVCPGDADYYRVLMNSGDNFTVTANFSHAEGDIDIRLLNIIGFPVGGSNSSTDNEIATYSATRIGTLIIEVSLYSDNGNFPGNTYTLDIVRQ